MFSRKQMTKLTNGFTNAYHNTGAKVATGLTLLGAATLARADGETGISSILDAVDLSGISTKIIALALVVVGIALVFKGPDIAKRIIRKV